MKINIKHYRSVLKDVERVKCPDGLFSRYTSVLPTLYKLGWKFLTEDYGYAIFSKKRPLEVAKETIIEFSKQINVDVEKNEFVYYPIYGGENENGLYIFYKAIV